MKLLLTGISFVVIAGAAAAAVLSTNAPDKDAFVRALAPASNYGGAGALSISGANPTTGNPTNGAFDSFVSFNTTAMVTNFNGVFGTNNWVITSATLNLTENPSPGNALFNYGTGSFEIRWIANDTWIEGAGNPNAPTTTTGVTYSEEPTYLNTNTDETLGDFTFAGTAKLSCPLALPVSFVTNMQAGSEVGLFMTAVDSQLGYVFYSRNFAGNPASLPALVVSAAAEPALTGITVSSTNLVLSATNGFTNQTYYVLTSTNLATPLNQWTPVLTNNLPAGGGFTLTVTNGINAAAGQYFILRTQ
jgi:hypothetical protein